MNAQTDPVSDVHWFADTLNADAGSLDFVQVERQALSEAPFLDERFSGGQPRRTRVPLSSVTGAAAAAAAPPHYIFHTAFCCSTLLARALDHPGTSLSLKEPKVLMDMANAKRVSQRVRNDPNAWREVSRAVLALLSRRFDPGEAILIKPTNVANNLIPDILDSGSRALLLYSDLRSFLVSVIKKGEGCRSFVRDLFNIFRLDPEPLGAIPDRQALKFTDLQVATLVWRHQMELYMQALRGPHAGRLRTLDCTVLLDRPAETLAALNDFFGLGLAAEQIGETAAGPVFAVNSKFSDRDYNAEQRAAEAREIEAQYGEALQTILEWAKTIRLSEDVPATMPNALKVPKAETASSAPATGAP